MNHLSRDDIDLFQTERKDGMRSAGVNIGVL
jgi:hypothetical protein